MVTVYSPLGTLPVVDTLTVAPLPRITDNITIAILDNSKHNFRALMDRVAATVAAKYPNVTWEIERKTGAAHPMSDEIKDRILRQANLVFTGSGD